MNDGAREPVDLEGFRSSMRAVGIEDVVDLTVEVYMEEAPVLFARLSDAVQEGDLDAVNASAHSLKSSSGNIWARTAASHFGEIEDAARAGDLDTVQSAFAQASPEFRSVLAFLDGVGGGT